MILMALAIVAFALVWLVVGIRYFSFSLPHGCLLVLFASVCLGYPFFHIQAGPFPVTIDRVLLAALVAVYVFAMRTKLVDHKRVAFADVLVFLYLGYITANTLVTDWNFDGNQPLSSLVFFFFLPFCLYWIARESHIESKDHKLIQVFWIMLGVYLAGTAILEVKQIHGLVFPRYVVSASFEEFFGRARGPLLNPIGNGLVITCCLATILIVLSQCAPANRVLVMPLVILFLAGIYCTLTRSVWLGAALGSVLIASMIIAREYRIHLVAVVTVLGVAGVIAKWDSLTSFKRDKYVSVSDMENSAKLRPILAAVAWKMFADNPIGGVGFGQYKKHDEQYFTQREIALPLEQARPYIQHNVFLSVLTQTGLIGLVLFIGMLIALFVDAWKISQLTDVPIARYQGLLMMMFLIAYCFNGMFHEVAVIPAVHNILFTLAGITRSVAARYCTENRRLGLSLASIGSRSVAAT